MPHPDSRTFRTPHCNYEHSKPCLTLMSSTIRFTLYLITHLTPPSLYLSRKDSAFQSVTSLKPPWLPEPWPLNLIAKHILICINVAFAPLVTSYGMELTMNVSSYFNTLYTALNCLWIAIYTVDCKLLKWRNSSIRCSSTSISGPQLRVQIKDSGNGQPRSQKQPVV